MSDWRRSRCSSRTQAFDCVCAGASSLYVTSRIELGRNAASAAAPPLGRLADRGGGASALALVDYCSSENIKVGRLDIVDRSEDQIEISKKMLNSNT